jgi:AraC-like DNA-binding protein
MLGRTHASFAIGAADVGADALASHLLGRFVAAARVTTPPLKSIDRLPDGTTTLIFRLLEPGRADLTLLGPQTKAAYKRSSTGLLAMKVVFRPGGAYPFFGAPMEVLTDRVIPARELWGRRADRLLDELVAVGVGTTPERLRARWDAMGQALLDRLQGPHVFEPASASIARAAVRKLSVGNATIDEIAGALNVSGRNLRRAFVATVGLSPKRFARIVRFQRVVSNPRIPRGAWPEIALASGYFDQSHLVADFREFAGVSPVAFAKRDSMDCLRSTCG